MLLDPTKIDMDRLGQWHVKAEQKGKALFVASDAETEWPGMTYKHASGSWDLSAHSYVAARAKNVGRHTVELILRLDNPGGDGGKHSVQSSAELAPGETKELKVKLGCRAWPKSKKIELIGMRGTPGLATDLQGNPFDPSNVIQVMLSVVKPTRDHQYEVYGIYAAGECTPPVKGKFIPFIDKFGQYMHKDWPRKTRSKADFAKSLAQEEKDLAHYPGPQGWNKYGGWAAGPKLKATGFFRAEKYKGKWWLVDPAGCLFWSHGIDCVTPWSAVTPISDREHFFKALPPRGEGSFYGKGKWAPVGYYQGKGEYDEFQFSVANLHRKYGEAWQKEYVAMAHRRLRSWGMNTIGNWSQREVSEVSKTPYVQPVHHGAPMIEGSKGYWGKFPDPFDPGFRGGLANAIKRQGGQWAANDPYCIGFFVDNELAWGEELELALSVLSSPSRQAAKREFLKDLKKKYGTIAKLNGAWGTKHGSWDALLKGKKTPDKEKAKVDLQAFCSKIAEEYFKICREEVKRVATHNMYLGCRFAWVNDTAVLASTKYCDVIGWNLYKHGVADFKLPKGVDMPVIIGEWHFGALDRGMFHPGLKEVENQAARAKAYQSYMMGALKNPCFVGAHWFQYGDQATTGRGDGENYQIGFVDICDTPYYETINAARSIGYRLYEIRSGR